MRSIALSLILATACGLSSGCAQTTKAEPVAVRPSVTIFPVEMAGQPRDDVARVVALMLEQRGMESIEVDETVFSPDADAAFDDQAVAFGAFAAERDLATEYALFGAVVGSPQHGVDEIRTVLVDRGGRVAWSDRQTRESRAMKKAKPSCPMDCTMFLVERLADPLDLGAPNHEATEGRWAKNWQSDSLAPSDAERGAIDARADRLRKAGSSATVLVYPARVGDTYSRECATRLAEEINRRGLLDATAATEPIEFEVQPARNQQQVLWSGARSIQELVRARPSQTDYVLVADYMIGRTGKAGAVHTFLLESDGDWVMVDFQNSHHDDFNRINPRSAGDCCDLSVKRLSRHLRS